MNSAVISEAVGKINSRYIEEAMEFHIAKKSIVWVKWAAVAASVCLIASIAYLNLDKINNTIVPEEKIVIFGETADNYENDNNVEPTRSKRYVYPLLEEKMKQYKGQDVLFGVVVTILITQEDSNECVYSEEYYALKKQCDEAWDVYSEVSDFYESLPSDYYNKLGVLVDMEYRLDVYRELSSELSALKRSELEAYMALVREQRLEYIKEYTNAELTETEKDHPYSSIYDFYYAQLSSEQINHLADKGGYSFRLTTEAMCDKSNNLEN